MAIIGASDTCQVSCLHQLLISEFVCKAEESMSSVVEYGIVPAGEAREGTPS